MQIKYLKAFSKDIDKLKSKQVSKNLLDVILKIKKANNIQELTNIEKLKGYKNAYRIRIGEFRIGVFIDANVIIFARFLPRKDIYKYFPK